MRTDPATDSTVASGEHSPPLDTTVTNADAELIAALARGDGEAADRFCARFVTPLWTRIGQLLGHGTDDVADLVQETILKVIRSAEQFDPSRGSLAGWVFTIAHNTAMSWHRTARAGDRFFEGVKAGHLNAILRTLDEPATGDRIASTTEQIALIREVLLQLPPDYASVLCAKYVDEQSTRQIAIDYGESQAAVRSRLSRAREAFRQRIRERLPDDYPSDYSGLRNH